MGGEEMVRNKQVVLRDYAKGSPKDSDMEIITNKTIALKVPEGSDAVLVKNLCLSCELFMGHLMDKVKESATGFASYTPGSVITGFGVCKVIDSGHPNFNKGDLVCGTTGWEEYSLITKPKDLSHIIPEF